ncbi:hypothetical protein PVE_R2G0913 [Pseudomonas veronii 1YdBTEX2]|uniref:Uncharacterized protein n=1 Tax=Pseudomonas veronii 1YdBTEX2 TaxID=1295141 RepID=A0A1D3K9F4_PSEVE|nr:hypothetical protein PVE_R2G0913 [Pseudomonas veronii 1YdBTEX2]
MTSLTELDRSMEIVATLADHLEAQAGKAPVERIPPSITAAFPSAIIRSLPGWACSNWRYFSSTSLKVIFWRMFSP